MSETSREVEVDQLVRRFVDDDYLASRQLLVKAIAEMVDAAVEQERREVLQSVLDTAIRRSNHDENK